MSKHPEHRFNRRQWFSIRRLNGQSSSRTTITGWIDALGRESTGATRWEAENPNSRDFYTPVEPTMLSLNIGLTGDRKSSARRRKLCFCSRLDQDLTIRGSKQVQIPPKFAGTITKTLWTYPPKESTIHSIVWEESTKSRARTGFSQNVKLSRTSILRSSWILGVLH